MQTAEGNYFSWLNWDVTFWTGIQRSQVQGSWVVCPSCWVLPSSARASQEQRDEDAAPEVDPKLQTLALRVVPDALEPPPGKWDVYHDFFFISGLWMKYLPPRSKVTGFICVNSEWCIKEKVFGANIGISCGNSGWTKNRGHISSSFQEWCCSVSGTLMWCSVTVLSKSLVYYCHDAYTLSCGWWDDGVRHWCSMFLQFCEPAFKEVCNSGFSDEIMLTNVLVFYATPA